MSLLGCQREKLLFTVISLFLQSGMKRRWPLLKDDKKAGSLNLMIAIRPREIEAFPFQNEGYKQLSL